MIQFLSSRSHLHIKFFTDSNNKIFRPRDHTIITTGIRQRHKYQPRQDLTHVSHRQFRHNNVTIRTEIKARFTRTRHHNYRPLPHSEKFSLTRGLHARARLRTRTTHSSYRRRNSRRIDTSLHRRFDNGLQQRRLRPANRHNRIGGRRQLITRCRRTINSNFDQNIRRNVRLDLKGMFRRFFTINLRINRRLMSLFRFVPSTLRQITSTTPVNFLRLAMTLRGSTTNRFFPRQLRLITPLHTRPTLRFIRRTLVKNMGRFSILNKRVKGRNSTVALTPQTAKGFRGTTQTGNLIGQLTRYRLTITFHSRQLRRRQHVTSQRRPHYIRRIRRN